MKIDQKLYVHERKKDFECVTAYGRNCFVVHLAPLDCTKHKKININFCPARNHVIIRIWHEYNS